MSNKRITLEYAINGPVTEAEIDTYIKMHNLIEEHFGVTSPINRELAKCLMHLSRIRTIWDCEKRDKEIQDNGKKCPKN